MFLQTSLTNRRKFLERSMWGFGSAFLLPSLLTSCTDHIIPPPDTEVGDPDTEVGGTASIFDEDIDWNNLAKKVVSGALGFIPEVGKVLSALVNMFWPDSKKDVWAQVRQQAESFFNQKIADLVYKQVQQRLEGLHNSTILYLNAVKNGNPSSILTQWIATRNSFAESLPYFQAEGNQLQLLPLFAQFGNMYLALLRDAVISGKSWGKNDAEQQQDLTDLKEAINDFSNYASNTYRIFLGIIELVNSKDKNVTNLEYFKAINGYSRRMTLMVFDHVTTWPYYDVSKYPTGAKVPLSREIYSDPIGWRPYNNPIKLPSPPTRPPLALEIWASGGINSIVVRYPQGGGPDGVTLTPRMGGSRGTTEPPYGGSVRILPNNPIVSVKTWSTLSPDTGNGRQTDLRAMRFTFLDGTETQLFGAQRSFPTRQDVAGFDSVAFTFSDHYLSSVYIGGPGRQGSADCVVYGFKYLNEASSVTLDVLQALYINSPKEPSVADFAQAFPTYGITQALITDELKAARQAYWASIEAQAEALK